MTSYTHKERIMAAWKGEKADRTCFFIDVGPNYSSQVNKKWPFSTINDYFGSIETATDIQVKSVADFPSDIVAIPQAYFAWQAAKENYRFKTRPEDIPDNGIKTMEDLDDLEAVPASEIKGLELLKESCRRITSKAPDYGTRVAVFGPMTDAVLLTGLENWIVNAIEQPDFVHKLMRLTTEGSKDRNLEMVKNAEVLILAVCDPYASISNISPKLYREFVFPYEKEQLEALQEASAGAKIIALHICGLIDPIMEDLAQLPLDWIELDGPSDLKKLFEATQGRMMIRGNIESEVFLEDTKDQMYDAVKNCLEIASGSPKYILSSGCLVPANAPLEQVRHFIDAALQYGA